MTHSNDVDNIMSPEFLHRRANEMFRSSHHTVFESLPVVVQRVIESKVWKTRARKFESFGEYALDQSVDGLSIDSNQKLWMLRCAMDVHGKHMAEWAGVLAKVEESVRIEAERNGKSIRSFGSNSLEELAKSCEGSHTQTSITYLPSRAREGDGHLMRIRRADMKVYGQVVSGKMSILEGRKAAGLKVEKVTQLGRAKSAIARMDDAERGELIAWMTDEGFLSSPIVKRQRQPA